MTPVERIRLHELLNATKSIWRPLPGPQLMAYESQADVIGFGGAAGGGKTDLAIGKSLQQHHEILIMRREATQLKGVLRRLESLLKSRDGYNGQDKRWSKAGPRAVDIEFGSCPNPGDETKHQGNPHDLLVFDEAVNFLESQVNFLLGWNRSTREGVHCQALLTFNPPTTPEGRWVVAFFAPWLDKKHPGYPAAPGELRYCVTVPDNQGNYRYEWVPDARPCVIIDGQIEYDFDPADYAPEDIVIPQSRTFIPSRISDNPYLLNTGYLRQLQAMPEPVRSQMLYGDFTAGMTDNPWQVIPTAWVEAAMDRWRCPEKKSRMHSMGVDVARGGKDNTVIARRHDMWFDVPVTHPGKESPDGPTVMGQVLAARRDLAPIHIDVIGVGSSPYDFLRQAGQQVIGVNVSEAATGTDKSGRLTFKNMRSMLAWRMREALDPANNTGICLPPDPRLKADLCAFTWKLVGTTIYVASRDEIIDTVGRSPDWASAYFLALIDTPRVQDIPGAHNAETREYDPYAKR